MSDPDQLTVSLLPMGLTDRYRPERSLGEGSYGRVVLAEDLRLGRQVAIKLLHRVLGDPQVLARFEREARLTSSLEHPHVVRVLDFGRTVEGLPFIVYEYVEGASLERVATDLSPEQKVESVIQVAGALAAVHERGVVHRDVKPGNILLRDGGDAVLCDFGIAHRDAGDTVCTQEGMVLGTPAYMAPELWKGDVPSSASDQFALAATLVRLLWGEGVFPAEAPAAILVAVEAGHVPRSSSARGELSRVLDRALCPDPAGRFPDCRSFAGALEAAFRHRNLGATGTRRLERHGATVRDTGKGERLAPRVLASLGLVFLLGVLISLLPGPDFLAGRRDPEGRTDAPEASGVESPPRIVLDRPAADLFRLRDSLRAVVEDLDTSISRSVREGPGMGADNNIEEMLDVSTAEDFPERWRAFLHAYAGWLEYSSADSPARDPADVLLESRAHCMAQGILDHLWEAYRTYGLGFKRGIVFTPAQERIFPERRIQLLGIAEEELGAPLESGRKLAPERLARLVGLLTLAGHADLDGVYSRTVPEIVGMRPGFEERAALEGMLRSFQRVRDREVLSCPVRSYTARALLAMLMEEGWSGAWDHPSGRVNALGSAIRCMISVDHLCPVEGEPVGRDLIVAAVSRQWSLVERIPPGSEQGIQRSIVDVLEGMEPLRERYPDATEALERLRVWSGATHLGRSFLEPYVGLRIGR